MSTSFSGVPTKQDVRIVSEAGRFPFPTSILYQKKPLFTHVSQLFEEPAVPGMSLYKRSAFDRWMKNNGQDWIELIDGVPNEKWITMWLEVGFRSVTAIEVKPVLQRERRRWLSTTPLEEITREFPMISGVRSTHRGNSSWVSALSLKYGSDVIHKIKLQDVFGAFMPMLVDDKPGQPKCPPTTVGDLEELTDELPPIQYPWNEIQAVVRSWSRDAPNKILEESDDENSDHDDNHVESEVEGNTSSSCIIL